MAGLRYRLPWSGQQRFFYHTPSNKLDNLFPKKENGTGDDVVRRCYILLKEIRMRFSLLLFVLKVKLKRAAKKYPEFKKKLMEKNYTMVIKTEDGARGRFFTFNNGGIESRRGDFPKAEISLVWKDAATAFRVMASGNNKAFMGALQDGSLKLQGDANLALAFTGVVTEMMKLGKK